MADPDARPIEPAPCPTAGDIARAVRAGESHAEDETRAALTRVAQNEDAVGAWHRLSPDLALAMSELALLLAGARDPEVSNPPEALEWARRARELDGEADALVVALDAAGETERAAAMASWSFPPGGAWHAYRQRQVRAFQRELLENPVEPLLLDVDAAR